MTNYNSQYTSYDYSNLKYGKSIKVERNLYLNDDVDITAFTNETFDNLNLMKTKSSENESKIFAELCKAVDDWEKQACLTEKINRAIEYLKFPKVKHTNNKWIDNEYGTCREISNAVYKMFYRVSEATKYDRSLKKSVPVAWYVTWYIVLNSNVSDRGKDVAGQVRKRFTNKDEAYKYINGRISKYSNLFKEEFPKVPKQYASSFMVNGKLLPGYEVENNDES